MIFLVFIALLSGTALADVWHDAQSYSFSQQVGTGHGLSYAITGTGRITGVRVWEADNNFIYGFQLRYGYTWTDVTGLKLGQKQEILLFEDEAIVAIWGKYAFYIQSVVFTTNLGRSLFAGRPVGHSFNMYPADENGELRFISGRFQGAITSMGAHWAIVTDPYRRNGKYLQ